MADDVAPAQHETSPRADGWPAETLEQRVRRLEDAVATLQDTRQVEERVVERVTQRLQQPIPPPPAVEHVTNLRYPPPPPPVPPPSLPSYSSAGPVLVRQAWLILDVWIELRALVRMFFDRRYRMAWSSRLTVLILVPLILTSHWWLPFAAVPIAGPLLDKVIDLILAFFVYKALSREARHYRELHEGRIT